jgi:hypothetical protein
MGMVAPRQRIGSAYFVICGKYGDVSRYAQERGVCRQWIYREAKWVQQQLEEKQQEIQSLRQQLKELTHCRSELEKRLAMSVVIDKAKQERLATVAQACGVSLPICWEFLDVLIPGQQESVAALGRATKADGQKAGPLLAVLEEWAQARVRDVAGDEIYVKDPVLMVVEQESLCWLTGRLCDTVDGEGWAKEFRKLPNLEQVARDGGKCLQHGVALVSNERQARGQSPLVDQGDHFHALRSGGVGLHKEEKHARTALAEAEIAQKELAECQRQGISQYRAAPHAKAAWRKAEKAMDTWIAQERLWVKTKEAMRLFTPAGELNTREQAEAVLAETLAELPDTFAKAKRQLQKPEMLNYLDHVQKQLKALDVPEEVKQAAVRQEGLRRRPELLQREGIGGATLRGVLLMCAVVLTKAGAVGQQAQAAVRDIIRRAYRASSLVECINSVVRMHQSRHRKMTQGLLDLKRLSWNCHTFRTGRRRGTTPYQRLGMPWPEGLRWWDVLKLTPEQLRDKLSTAKLAI